MQKGVSVSSVKSHYISEESYPQHGENRLGNFVSSMNEASGNLIQKAPGMSLAAAGIAGLGLGLLITKVLIGSRQGTTFDRTSAEQFGRRVLSRLENSFPKNWLERISSK